MGDSNIQRLTMPKWGLSMAQGIVVEWLVPEGAEVSPGTEIVEVESEKIAGAVEAPVAGTLRRHVAKAGQAIPVGGLLAIIADPGVSDEQIDGVVRDFALEDDSEDAPSDEISTEQVDVGGCSVRYVKRGEGSETVLLIHGFAGDLNNWLFNQGALANQRTVYALDLPGHGLSSKNIGQGTLEELVDVVYGWVDALSLSKLHLVGHSMGGAIALALALKHPDRVLSCTLIATAGLGDDIDSDYIQGIVNSARRKELTTHLQRLFADPTRVTRQLVDDMLKYKRLDGVREALRSIANNMIDHGRQKVVMREQLSRLGVPLLVLWGRQDSIIPSSHAEGLPDSVAVNVFEECGHMVQMEAANDANRMIARFLDKCAK